MEIGRILLLDFNLVHYFDFDSLAFTAKNCGGRADTNERACHPKGHDDENVSPDELSTTTTTSRGEHIKAKWTSSRREPEERSKRN